MMGFGHASIRGFPALWWLRPLSGMCPNPQVALGVHSFHGVESVTVIRLVSHEHPVDDPKKLSRCRDNGNAFASSLCDSRMESRELRFRIVSCVDVDRLREDPPEIRRTILADASVPHA